MFLDFFVLRWPNPETPALPLTGIGLSGKSHRSATENVVVEIVTACLRDIDVFSRAQKFVVCIFKASSSSMASPRPLFLLSKHTLFSSSQPISFLCPSLAGMSCVPRDGQHGSVKNILEEDHDLLSELISL